MMDTSMGGGLGDRGGTPQEMDVLDHRDVERASEMPDFANDIRIDPLQLDVEAMHQPMMFMQYAELAADAKRIMEVAKRHLDVVRANVAKGVRSNPGAYGVAKPTNDAVEEIVITDPNYVEAVDKLARASYDHDLLQAAVRAFDQRRSAIEQMIKLVAMQYFAAPREPRDIGEAANHRMDAITARAADKRAAALNNEPARRRRDDTMKEDAR